MNCQDECARPEALNEKFRRFSISIAKFVGTPIAFTISLFLIFGWALLGPIFHYSDSWQLVINTGTTIITFLMVFLIQNMQNRDAKAIHLKLDELIRAMKGARNTLVTLENLSEEELDRLQEQFNRIAESHRAHKSNEHQQKAA
jgi:low affinity Fe/Cu permease